VAPTLPLRSCQLAEAARLALPLLYAMLLAARGCPLNTGVWRLHAASSSGNDTAAAHGSAFEA